MIGIGDAARLLYGAYSNWEKHKENNEDVKRLRRRLADLIQLLKEHEDLAEKGENGRVAEVIRQLEVLARHSAAVLVKVEKQRWVLKAAMPDKAASALQALASEVEYATEKLKLEIGLTTNHRVQQIDHGVAGVHAKLDGLFRRQSRILEILLGQQASQTTSASQTLGSPSTSGARILAAARSAGEESLGASLAPLSLSSKTSNALHTSTRSPRPPHSDEHERTSSRQERRDKEGLQASSSSSSARPSSRRAQQPSASSVGTSRSPPPPSSPSTRSLIVHNQAEEEQRELLISVDFPGRVSAFMTYYRTEVLNSLFQVLYPPADPYPTEPPFDIISISDVLTTPPTKWMPATWVRVPALMPRVDRLPPHLRETETEAPVVPGELGMTVWVEGDRWDCHVVGLERDYAVWDVELRGGQTLRVMFDQAFRGCKREREALDSGRFLFSPQEA